MFSLHFDAHVSDAELQYSVIKWKETCVMMASLVGESSFFCNSRQLISQPSGPICQPKHLAAQPKGIIP